MISLPSLNRGDYFGVLLPEPANSVFSTAISNAAQFSHHTNDGSFFYYNTGANTGGYYNNNAAAIWSYGVAAYASLLANTNTVTNVCWKHTDNTYYIVIGNTANNNVRLIQITNPTSANTATGVGSAFATAATLMLVNHLSFDGVNFQLIYNDGARMLKISAAGTVVSDVALPTLCQDVLSTDIYLLGTGVYNGVSGYPVGLSFKKGNNLKSIFVPQWAWFNGSSLRSWGDKLVLTHRYNPSTNFNSGAPYAFNKSDFTRFLNEVAITL